MAKTAVHFLRIVQKLEKIRHEHAIPAESRGIVRGIISRSEEGTYKEVETFRKYVQTIREEHSILATCLGCDVRGSYGIMPIENPRFKDSQITGFWSDLRVILKEEGLDPEVFWSDLRKRFIEKGGNECAVLYSDWLLQWVAEHL